MIGIGGSIVAMALVLFWFRLETTPDSALEATVEQLPAAVVVAGEGNQSVALGVALQQAQGEDGSINKLIIDDVVLGEGDEVIDGSTVTVHYVGSLQNGQQFDNSVEKGSPLTFTIGEEKVIPGWERGILGMKEGGQRVLVIPAELAYGPDGFGPIPGDATLVFNIELIEVQ